MASLVDPAGRKQWDQLLAMLNSGEGDVNERDWDGNTALHFAAYNGHTDAIAMLVDKGANIEATDNDGATALHRAAGNGRTFTVAKLLEMEANIEATNNVACALRLSLFAHPDLPWPPSSPSFSSSARLAPCAPSAALLPRHGSSDNDELEEPFSDVTQTPSLSPPLHRPPSRRGQMLALP